MSDANILIVEDSLALAETYRGFLKAVTSQCEIAGTGKEAFEKLAAKRYDCIVLDVNLPRTWSGMSDIGPLPFAVSVFMPGFRAIVRA